MLRIVAIACALAASPARADTFCGIPFDAATKTLVCKDHATAGLAPLAKATALEELDTSSTRIADLAPLSHLAHLRVLDATDWGHPTDGYEHFKRP
jgi:hypothetical protein